MKRVHLICNAHLDPVWLWRWEEGCTEAISTYRVAASFIDEFKGFKFNHNEALLYEWVKENDPELYNKIKSQVADGKWNIIGGWYLQPDCNMPNGESIVRNILMGRMFFTKEFDKRPTTAINFDSFGHSRGLVQILNQAGYDSYVVCRPAKNNFDFKNQDYRWKGFNGAEITVHRSDENYNSVWGHVSEELDKFLNEVNDEEVSLFLWGVGDHGGGPSHKDLSDLEKTFEKLSDKYVLVHSSPEEYFKELREKAPEMPLVERGLNPVAEGCYTSQIRVKQKHRQLENELFSLEKMLTAAELQYGMKYPKEKLDEALRDLIFAEFHDALPGSGSQPVEEDTLRVLDHGLEIVAREKLRALIALSAGQSEVVDGASSVLIYNPHPYDITDVFEFEVGLPKQNWEDVFYYPEVKLDGNPVPTQSEMETSHFCIDWRKKVSIQATLKASTMHKLDVYFKAIPKRPTFAPIISQREFLFDNSQMQVSVNTATGLIDSYKVNGREYLKAPSFALTAYDDTYNSWGLGKSESRCKYTMTLLTPHEGSEFSGLGDTVAPSVRVIEDGEVRTVVEVLFGYHNSKAYQRYIFPKKGTSFDIETGVYWNEKDMYLKLEMDLALSGDYIGQVMFAHDKLPAGSEAVAQKWVAYSDGSAMLSVLNSGTYGSSCTDGCIGLTLLRSSGYSAADGHFEKTLHEVRHTVRMEQGERIFKFRVNAGDADAMLKTIDAEAQSFNERPYAAALCPSGKGEKQKPMITIDNKSIIVSCLKKAEDGDGYILRVYESEGKPQSASVTLGIIGISEKISLKAFEIKTFRIDSKAKAISETTLLEGN